MLAPAVLIAALVSHAAAHGMMVWPVARALPQDQQNGYSYAKGAINVNLPPHPDGDKLCNYLHPGPVFTQTLTPGPAVVDWTITAFHMGGCNVYISKDNQASWTLIGSDPVCGVTTGATTTKRSGHIPITIPSDPAGDYSAVLRWSYIADNGGQPENEAFGSCSDIRVSSTGNNTHTFWDILPTNPGSGDGQLPKTPWQFFSTSCSAGTTICSENVAFINQCISIGPSGTYNGGSGFYEYQCPEGSTCKSVNGVDACVGAGVVVPTTSAAGKTSTTTTTTTTIAPTTTTTTTNVPKPSTTSTTYTTTAKPTTSTTTTTVVPTTSTTTTTTAKLTTSTTTTTAVPTTSTTTTTNVVKPSTTSTTTTTVTKPTTTAAGASVSNGAVCTTYGSWACNNACICNYVAGNTLEWQCNPSTTTC
ncbi:UNVERIFIED_CONTAM: hypothetical protein HDU68_009467 [Siphonaria sp. JEL0065]|nr:hypothetical protein HDU68_009467 [Siphonaria sp. JEL0065]